MEISDYVMRIPLFELETLCRPHGVAWDLHVRCCETLCVSEGGATLVCSCQGAAEVSLREWRLLFLRRFAELLSVCLLLQVTEIWEEGPSGELLIVQNLLVPRKSHMVSNRREMGLWGA